MENARIIENKVDMGVGIEPISVDNSYDCHGNSCSTSLGENLYIAGTENEQDNISKVFYNTAEYDVIKRKDAKAGDIRTISSKDEYGNELINHSATYEGDQKYTSKDDRMPKKRGIPLLDMVGPFNPKAGKWGELSSWNFYRHKGNINGGVESDGTGKVTEEVAKEAIQNVKKGKE